MSRRLKFFIFLAVIIVLGISVLPSPRPTMCVDAACFDIELAQTQDEHQRGLGGRMSLGKGKGMLFVFEEPGERRFWMKGMNFPLDILWIDDQGVVVHIERALKPCVQDNVCPAYGPVGENIPWVLEIDANEAARLKIKHGSRAVLKK